MTAFAPRQEPDYSVGHDNHCEDSYSESCPPTGKSVNEQCDGDDNGDEIETKEQAFSAVAFRR
jgi:hypothetical protein